MNAYQKLKTIFSELSRFNYIQCIMSWDEAVMMPEGAGTLRADAMATFSCLLQKKLVNRNTKKLLDAAKQQSDLAFWDQANLAWMEKKYLHAACIPTRLTEKFTKETLLCQQAWRKLRQENNWRGFLPHFKRMFKLMNEIAKRRGDALHMDPYDALIDEYAPGFNQKNIDEIFLQLKNTIPQLIQQIMQKQQQQHITIPLGPFAISKQKELGLTVMRALQFDFNHGRLDISHHPFCNGAPADVRITTRYNEHEFLSSLLGICHETGHGLYEQGLPKAWVDQPVGRIDSMAMHESQSLLIERQVCGSKSFYRYLLPQIRLQFGDQAALNADNLFNIATQVKPNLIRVDADEVTYPLHIIMRYEIEKKLFKHEITIEELPVYWDEFMRNNLNLSTRGNDKEGVMQDVHWPSGAFGYFPAYTLGRLIAAQLFNTFIQAEPRFYAELEHGNFVSLHHWLQKNVYQYAASLPTHDFLLKVTGEALNVKYFLEHMQSRSG